jgi:membrane protease YdiL (CAAX protease family)
MMYKRKGVHIWLFFTVLYLLSGIFYVPILISGKGMYTVVNKILMVCITFLPSILGVIFVGTTWEKPARRDFWRRVYTLPRNSAVSIAISLGLPPVVNVTAYTIANLIMGEPFSLNYGASLFTQIPLLIQFLVVEFFLGAVSEELGWRGYVLDMLQERYSALTSSLITGAIWALWHTPAFLIPGLSQYEFGGVFSLNYFSMMIGVVAGSVFHTWSYNNTGRSIAVAGIGIHFVQNASLIFLAGIFEQFTMPILYWPISTLMYIVLAVFLVWRYGSRTLKVRTHIQQLKPDAANA